MRKFLLGAILLMISFPVLTAQTGHVPNELIVMLRHKADKHAFIRNFNASGQLGALSIKQVLSEEFGIYLLQHDAVLGTTEQVLRDVQRSEYVALAQLNHYVQLRLTPNDATFASQQWSLNNTGQAGGTPDADVDGPEAWDITTGGLTALGDTIVVAVVDGGFQLNHPDLQANIFRNYDEIPGNGIDDDNNGYIDDVNGWDAYANDGSIPSDNHGTHVAGIIGAHGNNNTGVAGVNWNVKVMTVAGSSGNEATVVTAYAYIAKMRKMYNQSNGTTGAFVVATNASFGVDFGAAGDFPIWCAMYDTLGSVGILNAGAGPNSNTNIDTQGDIPTTCPSQYLIAVTNTTRTDTRNASSGYGPVNMDIGAPGTQIYNTVTGSTYQNLTGTSMATPHVAGAIGLYYSGACSLFIQNYKQNPSTLALVMRNYLLTGVDSISSMATTTSSRGRLNLHKGLLNVQTYLCNPNSPPSAGFSAGTQSGCPGLSVTFTNSSLGVVTSQQWLFPGGTPSSSTAASPTVVYAANGQYSVTLIVTNAFGNDTLVMNNYIDINNTSTQDIFTETFEIPDFATSGWTVANPDGANTWQLSTVAGTTPGTTAARVHIFGNQGNAGQVDGLISPPINLSMHSDVVLDFEYAHRRRDANVRDSLWISASIDGGVTFPYNIFRGGGGTGFATGTILTTNFVPGSGNWCFTSPGCITADLSALDGQPDVRIRFQVQNNGGNNIYIDNIGISGVCSGVVAAPVAGASASDQNICVGESINFTDQTSGAPTSWAWSFPGGTPSTSGVQNPVITYSTAGTYDVQLTVSNASGSDNITLTNYITVNALPAAPVITQNGSNLESSVLTGIQWNDENGPISGETDNVFSPSQNGMYTVTFTDANGCSATSLPFAVTVGLADEQALQVSIFPNPVTDAVTVKWNAGQGKSSYRIVDIAGKLVHSGNIPAGSGSISIPMRDLPSGIYLLQLESGNHTATKRLVKVK